MSFNTDSYWRKEISNEIDNAYHNGYQQGREDAIEEMKDFIVDHGLYVTFKASEWAEHIKEQTDD